MERRVLLAITLSFLVLFLFQRFVMPPPAPVPAAAPVPANASSVPAAPGLQTPTASEASAREIIVETTKVKAVFSNRGGTIVHWILKEFRGDKGEPLDLVPQR